MDKKIYLPESELPTHYLNLNYYLQKYLGDLPEPPLNPSTKNPATESELSAIFPRELIKQEMSIEEYLPIPEPVRAAYRFYRPTPLIRASGLENLLKTPARIYYKYEGVSPVGSHKLNTALAQAYYNQQEGTEVLVTETGAGQWGSALSLACHTFGLKCQIFMVRISFEQKPYRRTLMELFGGQVNASPSTITKFGQQVLAADPTTPGSLGIAISEALEKVLGAQKTKYALGSVLNHVLLHQTIVGLETQKQLSLAGEKADVLIGCCGGGSNFAGLVFPFLADSLKSSKRDVRYIAVEPQACPTLTRGQYCYDFGDTAGLTPLLKMKTLGANFMPNPIHAGGLRYHGVAPLVAFLQEKGLVEARAYDQLSIYQAAHEFAKSEGIISAPESAHAIKAVIDEAERCKKENKKEVIVFNLSGHGLLDLQGYQDYLSGRLQ